MKLLIFDIKKYIFRFECLLAIGSNSEGESESEPNIEKYAFAAIQLRMGLESKICGIIKNPLIFVNFS